jgi:hypothetical protein
MSDSGGVPLAARTETQSVESDVDRDVVFEFVRDPRNLPAWAPGFVDTVTGDPDDGWQAHKDDRDFALRVVVFSDSRTVDILREVAPGREGGASTRVLLRPGGGSVVVMTLPILPGFDAATTATIINEELALLVHLADADAGAGAGAGASTDMSEP